jgi:RNA polymerase sigma factor (sigma-70 family)
MIDYVAIQRTAQFMARRLPVWELLDAEDLAQEAVVRMLVGRQSTRGPMQDALRRQGWIKQHRSGNGLERVELEDRSGLFRISSFENASIAHVDTERMLRLPTMRDRQAVMLHYLVGMTEVEIAEITGASVGAVRQRLYRGKMSMRRMIQ